MLTLSILLWPLISALPAFALQARRARNWSFISSLISLLGSLYIFCNFTNVDPGSLMVDVPWIDSFGIRFNIFVDGINLILVLLTNLLVPFILMVSGKENLRPASFYGLVLIMQMALLGVFLAGDGFLFYVFWELALIPIYFICLLWGGERRHAVTLKFFIYTLAGSLFMLIGLIILYFNTSGEHSFSMQSLYAAGRDLDIGMQSIVFWLMFLAFAIKMPVFPFHTWQPDTYEEAPVEGTMLLSGIMLKMGVFGVIRWLIPLVPIGVAEWGGTALLLSIIGIVYASCIALMQGDFKRLIAYSSIAHVGLIAAGVFTLSASAMQGAIVQMLSHGILVFTLFYLVDIIFRRTNSRNLKELGGIRHTAPKLATVFMIIMLSSVALPFTSGFVGEFLLLNALIKYNILAGAFAGLTIILGAVYMLRSYKRSMSGEQNALTENIADLTSSEKWILYPMVILVFVIGIYPAPLLQATQPAVEQLLNMADILNTSAR